MSQPKKKTSAAPAPEQASEPLPEHLVAALDSLQRGIVLRRDRLQEVVDDAVRRGRMTRGDAEDLVQSLVNAGRRQAEDLLTELERVVGRGIRPVEVAAREARKRTAASPVTREVDRARARVGAPGFPITGYDELTAAQVVERLGVLRPTQLRKVRDHELRNANRKSVLRAVDKQLA